MNKKIKVILLTVFSIFLLSACNYKSNESKSIDENPKSNKTISDTNKETLRIAMDLNNKPIRYINKDKNPEGLEVDMANSLGEYLGKKVEIINIKADNLIASIQENKADIAISGIGRDSSKSNKVDFSKPYMYARSVIILNRDFVHRYNITTNNMYEYSYGTIHHASPLITQNDLFKIPNLHVLVLGDIPNLSNLPSNTMSIKKVNTIQSGLEQIGRGSANAMILEDINLGGYNSYLNSMYFYTGAELKTDICVAIKKGNSDLLNKVNAFIDSMNDKGGFYEKESKKFDKSILDYIKDKSKSINDLIK